MNALPLKTDQRQSRKRTAKIELPALAHHRAHQLLDDVEQLVLAAQLAGPGEDAGQLLLDSAAWRRVEDHVGDTGQLLRDSAAWCQAEGHTETARQHGRLAANLRHYWAIAAAKGYLPWR